MFNSLLHRSEYGSWSGELDSKGCRCWGYRTSITGSTFTCCYGCCRQFTQYSEEREDLMSLFMYLLRSRLSDRSQLDTAQHCLMFRSSRELFTRELGGTLTVPPLSSQGPPSMFVYHVDPTVCNLSNISCSCILVPRGDLATNLSHTIF